MAEREDDTKERPATKIKLIVDDPDVRGLAEAGLHVAREWADAGRADTGGYPLAVCLVLLTMKRSRAWFRVAFAWEDEIGEQIAARMKPEIVGNVQDVIRAS